MLIRVFEQLEAQYLALSTLYPDQVGTWRDYLISNPAVLDGEGWRHLFTTITDVAFSDDDPSTCAYRLLENHGVSILTQAVSAGISPASRRGARNVIFGRWQQYVYISGGSYNQAEFVRKEMADLFGNR